MILKSLDSLLPRHVANIAVFADSIHPLALSLSLHSNDGTGNLQDRSGIVCHNIAVSGNGVLDILTDRFQSFPAWLVPVPENGWNLVDRNLIIIHQIPSGLFIV